MGLLDKRRPILPAPTDTTLESADETPVEQDLATDLSRVTDRSHQTIPDDGSPITVTTAPKKKSTGKLSKAGNNSQTSLLIEYFEHGPESGRKPSVRVKVNPSRSNKLRKGTPGHIVVTEPEGGRRPFTSHKIPLATDLREAPLDSNISSLDSEVPFGGSRAPVEIEVNQGSDLSKLSSSPEARYLAPESDISSMPAESLLGAAPPVIIAHPPEESGLSRGDMSEKENLVPPVIPTNRNASSERIAQKVIEKISNKPRTSRSAMSDNSRSRAISSRDVEIAGEPRRRPAKNVEDGSVTGTASSLVSGSLLSADPRSNDARSVRSGNSNGSITNPKLLQTVEDAIRRLILPELKEIKKDQRHTAQSRGLKDSYPSDLSESSVSREETTRRRSSSGKTKRRSSRENGHRVSSGTRRYERHRKSDGYDSPSEQSYEQSESIDSASVDNDLKPRKHKKSHKHRDMAAAGLAGAALTAAALRHHESGSSMEHRERRRKRSKSRSSRGVSVVEGEEAFHKHGIPPMPMRSDLDTELTRSSLLSSNSNGTTTPTRRDVREIARSSPFEQSSPATQDPTRTPVIVENNNEVPGDIRKGLGTHHGNFSEQDLAAHRDEEDGEEDYADHHDSTYLAAAGPIGHGLLTDPERARAYEQNLHHQHPIRRGLSPIQSVASYATTEPNRTSLIHPRSAESLTSPPKNRNISDAVSMASMSSVTSTDLAKSQRPQGISLENRSEIMQPHKAGQKHDQTRELFDDYDDDRDDSYRDSYASSGPKIPLQHMSNYTDDSMDAPYLDKVTAGQNLTRGYGANPEYIHTPPGVESAVASLYESSVLEARGTQSPHLSQAGSNGRRGLESPPRRDREVAAVSAGSPLKHQYSFDGDEQAKETVLERELSPPQSPALSHDLVEDTIPAVAKSVEKLGTTRRPEDSAQTSPESEITTNPSVIQGPINNFEGGNRDHWPYGPTPPPAHPDILPTGLPAATRDLSTDHTDLMPEALSISHPPSKEAGTVAARATVTPPIVNDEGYETGVTGANGPSPVMHERLMAAPVPFSTGLQLDGGLPEDEDPFATSKRKEYVSGLSQGMSPMYDGATGRGIDRIQSKDVVALMDHLTVRDAQRNARDTEILMTLVTTAAEMRNSFEDMRRLIEDQGDDIMDTADRHHEKTQKMIGGPRPQPAPPSARFAKTSVSEDDDLPAKRRNVFKRALRGLGAKNTQELSNIEAMLMQLLDDVDSLKGHQLGPQITNEPRSTSFGSAENEHPSTDPGYEPEGQAGTSSTGDQSGIFSNNSSRQANYRGMSAPPGTGNRVSTVLEQDEEYDEGDLPVKGDLQTTPRASYREQEASNIRGSSVPLHTPPRLHEANQGTLSNENTPQYSTEGSSGKKSKSFASSFFPKMVSRWSKTTASSVPDYRASTQSKTRPYSQVSHSGSNLPEFEHDPQGDDRLRSVGSLQDEQYENSENRPPSPLIPSQVSDNPKYQAHRNSVNLQHPQPRPGPTGRFQNRLENEAQYFSNDPISPSSVTSSQWENQAALSGMPGALPGGDYRHGGQLSPISDDGYSETSEAMLHRDRQQGARRSNSAGSVGRQGPPRPPKIPDDEPLVPQRPPKTLMSPSGNRQATYLDHVAAARAGSPAFDQSPVSALRSSPAQTRKPSGPRPLSGSGQQMKPAKGDMNTIKKTRFRGSPYHIESDENLAA